MEEIKDLLQDEVLEEGVVSIILKYKQHMEWRDMIDKYDGNWWDISMHESLSEEFMHEYKDKLFWKCISQAQLLSEEFIREYQNRVWWLGIAICQKSLSDAFREEFKDKL